MKKKNFQQKYERKKKIFISNNKYGKIHTKMTLPLTRVRPSFRKVQKTLNVKTLNVKSLEEFHDGSISFGSISFHFFNKQPVYKQLTLGI